MKKIFITICTFLLLTTIAFAQAADNTPQPKMVKNLDQFKRIMMLDAGRIKPLDTFARGLLLRLSGKHSFNKESATAWFARFIFAPQTTEPDQIFLINNPSIATALDINPEAKRRYTFAQIKAKFATLEKLAQSAQQIDSKKRDIIENEIIRLYENVQLYSRLSLSMSFAFPHDDFVVLSPNLKTKLNLPRQATQFSFLDIAQQANELQLLMMPLEKKSETQWSEEEKELVNLVNNLVQWSSTYQQLPLTIIASLNADDETWFSPWDIWREALADQNSRKEMLALGEMMVAYWNGEQVEFDLAAKTFNQSIAARIEDKHPSLSNRINLEVFFNQLNLFFYAKTFYLLAFFIFLFGLANSAKIFYQTATALIVAGFALHAFALFLRIIILQRPPVSSLYETFIFVGFISVISGLLIEWRNRRWLGHVISAVSGFIFLTIASKFSVEGDTLQMLVAVLNSNFWLGTHVTSITTGYAGACVAGIIGHIYILQAIFKSKDKALLDSTYRTLVGALGFALTMTFLGTNLGGIWADQSWGRFWGWDPKENGALLIIIWTALLFHLKVGNFVGPLGLAIGSVIGIIVVMWAWFGVNLLSIGLHSYGFTSGLATNLAIYVILQVLFLLISVPIARKKLSR